MHIFDHNFLNFFLAFPPCPKGPESLPAIDSGGGWLSMKCVFGSLLDKWPWMDTEVMSLHIKHLWGDKRVLLFCDNLSAHVAQETREIYARGNVFLYFLPPNVTESLQAIDSGCGWLLMTCVFGCLLDKWPFDKIACACGRTRRVNSKT